MGRITTLSVAWRVLKVVLRRMSFAWHLAAATLAVASPAARADLVSYGDAVHCTTTVVRREPADVDINTHDHQQCFAMLQFLTTIHNTTLVTWPDTTVTTPSDQHPLPLLRLLSDPSFGRS
jgi:hypothetical protein